MSGVTVFSGGLIFTGNRSDPWVDAIATRGSEVVSAGGLNDVRNNARSATEIDLGGRMVVPVIDAHDHFLSTGESMASLDLRYPTVDSKGSLLEAIRRAAADARPNETISGFGFDHGKYDLPTLVELDTVRGEVRHGAL